MAAWKLIFLFSITLTILATQNSDGANAPSPYHIVPTGDLSDFPPKSRKKLKTAHNVVSLGLIRTANRIDQFFGNKKDIEGKNRTNIRLANVHLIRESEKPSNETTFRLNLRLPELEKRFQFTIEKRSETIDPVTPIPNSVYSTQKNRNEEDVRAGLSYFRKLPDFNAKLTTGLKFSSTPVPYANLRIGKETVFGFWRNKNVINFHYNREEKFGQLVTIDFDHELSSKFLLRLGFEETYLENDNTTRTSIGPILFQKIQSNKRLSYSLKINANNRPTYHLSEYYFGSTYRQNIYEDFLYFEISPCITWREDNSFSRRFGIVAKVELVFAETLNNLPF